MTRVTIFAAAVVALSLAACERSKAPNEAPAPASSPTATTAPANAAPAEAIPVAAGGPGYKSREGNVFYYQTGDGELIGALDLGTLPQTQDQAGRLKAGDRAIQFDGRVFAAVTPGSSVVRVYEMRVGEQIFRPAGTYALDGSEVAATAMRDSLAGRLLYPAAGTEAAHSNVDEDSRGNARPDDYEKAGSEDNSMVSAKID